MKTLMITLLSLLGLYLILTRSEHKITEADAAMPCPEPPSISTFLGSISVRAVALPIVRSSSKSPSFFAGATTFFVPTDPQVDYN